MKPPQSRTAITTGMTAVEGPSRPKPDCHSASVNASDLEQLARAYVMAADAEHAAKLARLEARDRLIECVPIGFESEGVRVQRRNCWKLNPEAVAEMTSLRAALIDEGKAELVPTIIAVRIGREEE